MRVQTKWLTGCIAALMLLGVMSGPALAQGGGGSIVVITEDDIGSGWYVTSQLGKGEFALTKGPDDPPLGSGSLKLTAEQLSDDRIALLTNDFKSNPVSAIEGIQYFTYRSGSSTTPAHIAPAVNVTILYVSGYVNGVKVYGAATLAWEPRYGYGESALEDDVWQQWDTSVGAGWWSNVAFSDLCAVNCVVSWQTVLDNLPADAIVNYVGLNLGQGPAGSFDGAVDAFSITVNGATTTYDFETNQPDGPAVGEPGGETATLYAGQHHPVGAVSVWVDGDDLYVKYRLSDDAGAEGWVFTELHLAVADGLAGIPQTRGRVPNPIPGQFPYRASFDQADGATEQTFPIHLPGAGLDAVGRLVIAAHADILNAETLAQEAAWAACEDRLRFTERGNWATYFVFELD